MQLLGRHPDAQAAVHSEIANVLAGRAPHADDIARLTLTEMAVKEAMRLYPPAYGLGRLAEHEVTISGYRIPAGSIILLSPWATHRRPDLWPEPLRFDPARFEPAAEQDRPRYAYFPFAGGLRGCIGGHFAMTEAVVAIATLLARFSVASDGARYALCSPTSATTRRPCTVPARSSAARPGVAVASMSSTIDFTVPDRTGGKSAHFDG